MRNFQRRLTSLLLAAGLAVPVFGGSPIGINIDDPDKLMRWGNGGVGIPFNPDQGGLGDLSNEEAMSALNMAIQIWEDIPTSGATYSNMGALPYNVDETNFVPFIEAIFYDDVWAEPDGLSPIVFDDNGEIFNILYGPDSGIYGFAAVDTADENGVAIEGLAFFNGARQLSVEDWLPVFLHELGHYSGLHHSVVNGQAVLYDDGSGPAGANTFGEVPYDQVETMYPFLVPGGGAETLHKDDISFYSRLYPAPGYLEVSAGARGTVFDIDGITPLDGVNVIARNVDNPFVDAVSSITGDRGEPGTFFLEGLTPGASYAIYVDQIFDGEFAVFQTSLSGSEEFYNGSNESADGLTDNIFEYELVQANSGEIINDLDIYLNGPTPGAPLSVGDDGYVLVDIPFDFNICGNNFNSVFINANGIVSFGEPFDYPYENPIDFLSGPPVIAGVWDDLAPNLGGKVIYYSNFFEMVIRWEDVPEISEVYATPEGSNTFEIVLKRNFFNAPSAYTGNPFELNYENGTIADGLAGFSCGATETSLTEQPDDLSKIRRRTANIGKTAYYEYFHSENPNDLIQGSQITFLKTKDFYDVFEDNNSLEDNQFVFLPFNSSPNYYFTELSPEGNDVDYFSFYAPAGNTIVASTLVGDVDTLLGLFDSKGELIAQDDDSGSMGLSKIAFFVEESGFYQIAVTSSGDVNFIGDGGEAGRYVLDIDIIEGYGLALTEDGSQELSLPFNFNFLGEEYSSVFVNANGNLTFGEPSDEFIASPENFLSGPPRIASFWADLSPQDGGDVIVTSKNDRWSIEFVNVPEYITFGSIINSFKTTLFADGRIEFNYGRTDSIAPLVGIGKGNNISDPGKIDFSSLPVNSVNATIYESFDDDNPFDLEGSTLLFQ